MSFCRTLARDDSQNQTEKEHHSFPLSPSPALTQARTRHSGAPTRRDAMNALWLRRRTLGEAQLDGSVNAVIIPPLQNPRGGRFMHSGEWRAWCAHCPGGAWALAHACVCESEARNDDSTRILRYLSTLTTAC